MKNFFDRRDEKITDKAFKKSITISVVSILLCIVALCSTTWAWFSQEVASSHNSIKSANCNVSVSVTSAGAPVDAVDGKYTFVKDAAYEIKMTATGTAKTAYCVLNIGGTNYYTVQIPTDAASIQNSITFTLQFSADTTAVEIFSRWGTSSQEQRHFADGLYYLDLVANQNTEAEGTNTPSHPATE